MLARYAALLSFAATALALSSGDLTVKLSAVSPTVSSIDDIILTAVVSNPTSEDIRFVKFNSVLDELPTKSFKVKKGDVDVTFSGVDVVPAITEDAAFITVPAGGSIAVNHTVAASYDFESVGAGTFTFDAITNLRVAEGNEITHFVLDAASVDVEVTDDVSKRSLFPESANLRTSTPVCNDANRRNYLAASLTEARAVAGGAAANIRQSPNSANFATYFNNHNRNDIWYNFDRIAGDLASSGNRGLHCVDRAGGICKNGGIAAYVLLVTSGGNIVGSEAYFCDWFFTSTRDLRSTCSGTDFPLTRTNVMLHELTHAIFASGDIVYGCPGSRGLGDADKKKNADNYTCFGMHNWKQYNC
ncbi:Deuterolysin metalloprotease family-domain-containing protein [Pterulicium gracile]|uniref:deuterolysin n=1 Tax=Pterulicium gracile TaxID=1884261 RepID=A0A5C3QQ15_9AGAR|nr:Deuterolysin metalloprotease family-domain-containing protein [Pterula gracilis]